MVVLPPIQAPVAVYVFVCEVCGGRDHTLWEDPKLLLEFFDCIDCGHRITFEEAIDRPAGLPATWFLLSLSGLT